MLQVTGQLLGRVVVQDSRYFFLGCLISSLNYMFILGATGRKSSSEMRELGESVSHQTGGSWSARAKKREEKGENSSSYSTRCNRPDPASFLEPTTPVKRKQVESISPESFGSTNSKIDDNDVEGGK